MSKPKVLITGGAGSLGKAFVKYLSNCEIEYDITVVDNNEWAVAELRSEYPDVTVKLQDFDHFTGEYSYVVHCAAYKHVNLGEENVGSFIQNNLIKTMRFYGGIKGRILYISTDKAVEPISAYGATKYLAEKLTWAAGGSVARCGNFLHSSGSVIPVWEKQIAEGKPITITDYEMVRYVADMDKTVPYLWAKFLNRDKLIVPVMKKVKITDLIAEVMEKHGIVAAEYRPGFTLIGLRPGEKLEEKLRWEWEDE